MVISKVYKMPPFVPYISIFDAYPALRTMPPISAQARIPPSLHAALLNIGKAVRATKHVDRVDQRNFLDEKVVAIVRPIIFLRLNISADRVKYFSGGLQALLLPDRSRSRSIRHPVPD